jgi:2-methylaconitate cis-trans-isomerase PrpF
MAIRFFTKSSLLQGLPKGSKAWDQVASLIIPNAEYLVVAGGGGGGNSTSVVAVVLEVCYLEL